MLRFFFDPGSGVCLWSGNDAARERFGYPVESDLLPLSDETREEVERLIARYDESVDWRDPASEGPWTFEEKLQFAGDARRLLERLRRELGEECEIRDEARLP